MFFALNQSEREKTDIIQSRFKDGKAISVLLYIVIYSRFSIAFRKDAPCVKMWTTAAILLVLLAAFPRGNDGWKRKIIGEKKNLSINLICWTKKNDSRPVEDGFVVFRVVLSYRFSFETCLPNVAVILCFRKLTIIYSTFYSYYLFLPNCLFYIFHCFLLWKKISQNSLKTSVTLVCPFERRFFLIHCILNLWTQKISIVKVNKLGLLTLGYSKVCPFKGFILKDHFLLN